MPMPIPYPYAYRRMNMPRDVIVSAKMWRRQRKVGRTPSSLGFGLVWYGSVRFGWVWFGCWPLGSGFRLLGSGFCIFWASKLLGQDDVVLRLKCVSMPALPTWGCTHTHTHRDAVYPYKRTEGAKGHLMVRVLPMPFFILLFLPHLARLSPILGSPDGSYFKSAI